KLKPDCAKAHMNLAIQLAGSRQFASAIEHYGRAIALGLDASDVANAHRDLAITLMDMHRTSDAIQEFEETIRLEPKRALDWANLAAAYGELGRDRQAMDAAARAIELAQSTGQHQLARDVQARLARYRLRLAARAREDANQ